MIDLGIQATDIVLTLNLKAIGNTACFC